MLLTKAAASGKGYSSYQQKVLEDTIALMSRALKGVDPSGVTLDHIVILTGLQVHAKLEREAIETVQAHLDACRTFGTPPVGATDCPAIGCGDVKTWIVPRDLSMDLRLKIGECHLRIDCGREFATAILTPFFAGSPPLYMTSALKLVTIAVEVQWYVALAVRADVLSLRVWRSNALQNEQDHY